MLTKKTGVILLLIITGLVAGLALLNGPLPQPPAYHDFADRRVELGVPNAWDVFSNGLFALAGAWGLFLLFSPGKVKFIDNRERWMWVGVSAGLILTAIGSGYYHLAPDNARLVWDRLPMTVIFTSYVAALISERIGLRLGIGLWPILLGLGFLSVFQWYESELRQASDLRFYASVQVLAILTTLVLLLIPSRYTRSSDYLVVIILFGLARVCEIFDHQISELTQNTLSGHTLKHLAAGIAGIWLIRMIGKRKIKEAAHEK